MVLFDYFEELLEGIEYLIALGSLLGLLGVLMGLIFFVWGSKRMRYYMTGVVIVSFILLGICGLDTGLKYFRIFR
jgi:hypothetical protein